MKTKTIKTPPREGDCYDANGREFLDLCGRNKNEHVNYLMVHGVVINSVDKKPMGHAWIEATLTMGSASMTTCLDFANGHAHSLSKETYYVLGGIAEDKVVRYTLEEYKKKILESGHWGHWDLDINEDR